MKTIAILVLASLLCAIPASAVEPVCQSALSVPGPFIEVVNITAHGVVDPNIFTPAGTPVTMTIPVDTRGILFENGMADGLVNICWEIGYAMVGSLLITDTLILQQKVSLGSLKGFRSVDVPLAAE